MEMCKGMLAQYLINMTMTKNEKADPRYITRTQLHIKLLSINLIQQKWV